MNSFETESSLSASWSSATEWGNLIINVISFVFLAKRFFYSTRLKPILTIWFFNYSAAFKISPTVLNMHLPLNKSLAFTSIYVSFSRIYLIFFSTWAFYQSISSLYPSEFFDSDMIFSPFLWHYFWSSSNTLSYFGSSKSF